MANDESKRVIVLGGLPEHVMLMLRQIPHAEELESPEAEARWYPEPSEDAGVNADWNAYVQPDLHERFRSSRDVVESDLKRMQQSGKDRYTLEIPVNHADAWLNALNQLRLAIAAAHQLGDADLSHDEVPDAKTPRELAVLRVHFYGYLQHVLIDALEDTP